MTKAEIIRIITAVCTARRSGPRGARGAFSIGSPAAGGGIAGPSRAPKRRATLTQPQTGDAVRRSRRR